MTTAHIDLTAIGDDESRRRRDQRGAKALIVLAGLILLAFAGHEPEPVLRLNGNATDFGSQIVGTRWSKQVGLRNAARTPFVVAGIVAEGASIQDFSIDVTGCGRILPGALCKATVSFSPHVTGLQSARFRIVDASNDRSETIVIQGAGMLPSTRVSVQPQERIAPTPQLTQQVTTVIVTPPPALKPEPVPVTPPLNRPPSSASRPPVKEIVVQMPPENETPSATPTPPVPQPMVTPTPRVTIPVLTRTPPVPTPVVTHTQPVPPPVVVTETTEPPAKVVETKTPDAPTETTTREPSRTKERFKRFAAVAIPLIATAVIANQNHGHSDHNADRRIEVSPRSLMLQSNRGVSTTYLATQASTNIVTVTNVGRDSVTIGSIEFAGGPAGGFMKQTDCERRTLAPKAQCRILVALGESGRGAHSTLVVNSDGGRATVDLAAPSSATGKPQVPEKPQVH